MRSGYTERFLWLIRSHLTPVLSEAEGMLTLPLN
jgi:hypothetical protein